MVFRVLVVDDNEEAASTLATILELQGYETEVAHDGADALRKASTFRPQLVILDIFMPVMDGVDAAKALRRHVPHVRIVAVTGNPTGPLQTDKVFDAVFRKPADPVEVLATVDRLVNRA